MPNNAKFEDLFTFEEGITLDHLKSCPTMRVGVTNSNIYEEPCVALKQERELKDGRVVITNSFNFGISKIDEVIAQLQEIKAMGFTKDGKVAPPAAKKSSKNKA